jgi:N-acetylglutamate synthase-like GNAT family acetyltransferase
MKKLLKTCFPEDLFYPVFDYKAFVKPVAFAGIIKTHFDFFSTFIKCYLLCYVCVHPDYRLQGRGIDIVEKVIKKIPKNEPRIIVANCAPNKVEFYEKCGFSKTELRAIYTDRNDEDFVMIRMVGDIYLGDEP